MYLNENVGGKGGGVQAEKKKEITFFERDEITFFVSALLVKYSCSCLCSWSSNCSSPRGDMYYMELAHYESSSFTYCVLTILWSPSAAVTTRVPMTQVNAKLISKHILL